MTDAHQIMTYMLQELSTLKYGYRSIVEGCYDDAVSKFGEPLETTKKDIVTKVIEVLNND